MGEVVRPQHPLENMLVRIVRCCAIVLEGHEDVLVEVLARWALYGSSLHPEAMAVVGVVHPVGKMRHPARIGFDADDLQLRLPLEDATEAQHPHDVLVAADQLHERVDSRPAALASCRQVVGLAGQDVEADRQSEVGRALPKRVVALVVVVLDVRVPRQHDADEPEARDFLELLDSLLDAADRGDPDTEQPVARRIAEDGQPAVVGVEAGLLVVDVPVQAEHHADARVDDLGVDAVPVLGGQPLSRVPAAGLEVVPR